MYRRCVTVAAVTLIAALGAAQAASAQSGDTITATGTGQAKVTPKNRHNSNSIATAYDAARQAAIKGALSEAHEYAVDYAEGVGLTLGSVISVTDAQANGFYEPDQIIEGPFGPDKFCGKEGVPVFKKVNGKRKLVKIKREHRCFVPANADITLTVTYSAS